MSFGECDVLVLGGGIGGLIFATTLRKFAPMKRITLIDERPLQSFPPSYLWVMSGARKPQRIVRSLDTLAQRGITFFAEHVDAIQPESKRVRLISGREVTARESMLVSLGAELRPDLVPGLAEAGLNLYSLDQCQTINERLANFAGGRIIVLTAEPLYKCPAAPYEAALLIDYRLRKQKARLRSTIQLFAAESAPMGTAGPKVSEAVRQLLSQREISYFPEHQAVSVNPTSRQITFTNGKTAGFDLLVYVPPHRAPQVLEGSGLLGPTGWIPVDRQTLATSFAGVYAIGDNTVIPLSMGKPLPKAGVFAHRQAEVVAHNLARPQTPRHFDGKGACFIEVGFHRAGMGSGDFYAEPAPRVVLRSPSVIWHWAKVAFEKDWLWRRY